MHPNYAHITEGAKSEFGVDAVVTDEQTSKHTEFRIEGVH